MYHYSAHIEESSQTPAEKALNADEPEETVNVKQSKRNRKKKPQQNDVPEVAEVAEVATVVAGLKESITVASQHIDDNEAIVEPVKDNIVDVIISNVEIESQEKSINSTQEEEICAQPDALVVEVVAEEQVETVVAPVGEQTVAEVSEETQVQTVVAPVGEVVAEEQVETVAEEPEKVLPVQSEDVGMIEILSQQENASTANNANKEDAKFISLMENMCVPKKWWEFWK